MYYNKETIDEELKECIIETIGYISNSSIPLTDKEVIGDLFTRLRRRLIHLVVPSSTNIQPCNIDLFYNDVKREITYLKFKSNYGGCTNVDLIQLLNQALEKTNIDFSNEQFKSKINKIITSLQYYTHG